MSDDRSRRLRACFERAYSVPPSGIARAPGRVNLIGEHVDYCGLPVFPMALERAVRVAFRPRGDALVRATATDPAFEPRAFELADEIAPYAQGDWGNYLKAAAQALRLRPGIARGADLAIDGDVPHEAGLSSSSALVVACTLALLAANAAELAPAELMEHCARAERYVGTASGGMDQAISLGARAGHASVIEFDPVRLEPVPVPAGWRFVIANSLVRAPKSGAARAAYNARTRECRAALEGLRAHARGRALPATWRALVRDVAEEELDAVARAALDDVLFRRFRHVVGEGRRVGRARAAMLAGDLERFGALMSASHASLRDDFEVSCAELERLVALETAGGAAGARLTGAGFGGCTVALCRAGDVERLSREVEVGYYRPLGVDPRAADALFVAVAAAGAEVLRA